MDKNEALEVLAKLQEWIQKNAQFALWYDLYPEEAIFTIRLKGKGMHHERKGNEAK